MNGRLAVSRTEVYRGEVDVTEGYFHSNSGSLYQEIDEKEEPSADGFSATTTCALSSNSSAQATASTGRWPTFASGRLVHSTT